jgi:hypothetical protein
LRYKISDLGAEILLSPQGRLKGRQKIELNQRLQPPNGIMQGLVGLFTSPAQLSWGQTLEDLEGPEQFEDPDLKLPEGLTKAVLWADMVMATEYGDNGGETGNHQHFGPPNGMFNYLPLPGYDRMSFSIKPDLERLSGYFIISL